MDTAKLEKHLIVSVQEAHAKLGFDDAPMTLNYTLSTLNHILGTELSAGKMGGVLGEFCSALSERLGRTELSSVGDVFCLTISPELRRYIRDEIPMPKFLGEFIKAVGAGKSLDEILGVFRRYSDKAHIEQVENDEFDYLCYFEDGVPDDCFYCLTVEDPMISYHRFSREDYLALGL